MNWFDVSFIVTEAICLSIAFVWFKESRGDNMKIKKKVEGNTIKKGFEPETVINSGIWSILEIVKDVKEEKDPEGNLIRSAVKNKILVEFFSNESRLKYIEDLRAELGDRGVVNVLIDNNSSWVMNKLLDDVEYLQNRVSREEIRRREE